MESKCGPWGQGSRKKLLAASYGLRASIRPASSKAPGFSLRALSAALYRPLAACSSQLAARSPNVTSL
jgi:hypothetical protein